ncbi:MAG: hypothetical protein ACYDEB_01925 [Dehalococcoidia bacterium]
MPAPGLSLFGFMPQPDAENYLKLICALGAGDDPASMWAAASAQLGTPIADAGNPKVEDITTHKHQVAAVLSTPQYAQIAAEIKSPSLKLVEIGPLLAFQYHVFTEYSRDMCAHLHATAPTLTELMAVCLPQLVSPYEIRSIAQVSDATGSVLVECNSPNLKIVSRGSWDDPVRGPTTGVSLGITSPLVQVVRLNGRCYLRNGYHRVYGAALKGATAIPCVFGELDTDSQLAQVGGRFDKNLLESGNPPTMGHFMNGRAFGLTLRRVRRVIAVSWVEYAIPEYL